jgi:hypothetical protein
VVVVVIWWWWWCTKYEKENGEAMRSITENKAGEKTKYKIKIETKSKKKRGGK